MPAQRKKRRVKKNYLKKRKTLSLKLLPILVGLGFLVFLFLNTKYWSRADKLSLVINRQSGDVIVTTFDPRLDEHINIIIPADTQVEVSRQLGSWKIKSVWRLGENEGLDGKLLAETVTRHFKTPVVVWADRAALGFSTANLPQILAAALTPYKTNLTLWDRLNIALFVARVKNTKRVEINLADGFLIEKKLIDGSRGYVLEGSLPQKLLVVFSDPEIAQSEAKVVIRDATDSPGISEIVGEIVEVLGAKVAVIKKEDGVEDDCRVSAGDEKIAQKVADVFSCSYEKSLVEGNFDLEIRLGKEFAERF